MDGRSEDNARGGDGRERGERGLRLTKRGHVVHCGV